MKFIVLALAFYSANTFSQDVNKGKELYATCIECHGEKGLGNVEKEAPKLAGQYDWYIESSIKAFKTGTDRKNPVMLPFIKNLSDKDIKDLAAYISQLK